MKLYLKLALFVALFLGIQNSIDHHRQSIADTIFAARCWAAAQANDDRMFEPLIRERECEMHRQWGWQPPRRTPAITVHFTMTVTVTVTMTAHPAARSATIPAGAGTPLAQR